MATPISISISKNVHRAGSLNPNKRFVKGETPLPQITATDNDGEITWSDGGKGGRFTFIDGQNVLYEPANKTQIVTITATDSSNSATASLTVFGTFPLYPNKGFEIEYDETGTKKKTARDGTPYFSEQGRDQITWKLPMNRRLLDEAKEVWEFLTFHRRTKLFWVYDQERKLMNQVRRVSSLPQQFEGANSWTQSVILQGDYAPIELVPMNNLPFKVNSGSFVVDGYEADKFFVNGNIFDYGDIVVNMSGVSTPSTAEIFKTVRYGETVEYQIRGLAAFQSYEVHLLFCGNLVREMELEIQNDYITNIITIDGYRASEHIGNYNSDANGEMKIKLIRVSGANALIAGIYITQ